MAEFPTHSKPPGTLARTFAPLISTIWIFFLVWCVIAACVWAFGIGESEMLDWMRRHLGVGSAESGAPLSAMQQAMLESLRWIDPGLAILAATNAYLLTASREGLRATRRWSLIIFFAVAAITSLSAFTHLPLGTLSYTDRLGHKLGPIPFCLPLLWLAVILGARDLVLRVLPRISRVNLAIGVGLLAVIFDATLEPLASRERWWLWYPTAPFQNYLTWFAAGGLLTFALREDRILPSPQPATKSPAAIYLILIVMQLVALAGRFGRTT